MLAGILSRVFGSANERLIRKFSKTVDEINALEPAWTQLSDEALREKTESFKIRLAQGETLDALLPEAFATVREAGKRVLGQRHYDVQLIGGMILHQGKLAEMATGEGKTLVSTLPLYLNALTGKGAHLITVNDYLAKRDSEWMGGVHRFLGLTVGCVLHDMSDEERRAQYASDITYVTNHELGFDYLRDNMKFRADELVQRPFQYAIVDEVDSILIDEARTPLIISGPAEDSSDLYRVINQAIPTLAATDYEKEEKHRSVSLTDSGVEKVEEFLRKAGVLTEGNLYDLPNVTLVHHINQALRAHTLYHRDKEYMVRGGKVMIVDEFTGRVMEGRRYSDGLHQAIEAKEDVKVEVENQTLASITYQNLFRVYPKLSGMAGTAMTEAGEFSEIYKLEVVTVPTNKPVLRKDMDDEVYRTEREKYDALLKLVKECQARQQPMLIGTTSVEKSEDLSKIFDKEKIAHNVLNAKHHEKEAHIIAQAGCPGTVTIATNMAGRGTDIQLGGNIDERVRDALEGIDEPAEREKIREKVTQEVLELRQKVKDAGGLFVVGTERHESRRIDNQLRGRSGRQGDPGASKFFLSLQDDLMRIFGSERMDTMLQRLGMEEGEAIISPWINKALERAQKRVEAHNFDVRKHLLKYDDVMNEQRKVIYEQRREIMAADDVEDVVNEMILGLVDEIVERHVPENSYPEKWDLEGLHVECHRLFGLQLPVAEWGKEQAIVPAEIHKRIEKAVVEHLATKFSAFPEEFKRYVQKTILLSALDQCWKEHLLALDHLRQGINLRAYAQKDPLNEYKREAFELFEDMLLKVRERMALALCALNAAPEMPLADLEPAPKEMLENRIAPTIDVEENVLKSVRSRKSEGAVDPQDPRTWGRVQRNALCPCGSGKKYKACHGAI